MGVPAFFRYMTEKYPKIIEQLVEDRVPPADLSEPLPQPEYEFDNLYIDMNGIIHPCSHPEDRPPPKNETEMYHNVTRYVDRLFAAVRPRKLLYLAIDGVAPRAKMNQQRARRFRAAQDANERNALAAEARSEMMGGAAQELEDWPDEAKDEEWDSNVITPGTTFMHGLSEYLRWYIAEKISRGGKGWSQVTVVLSDASEPGEGEHKIMAYIRQQRTSPGYNPNLRHVLHGLDADLIMLGLALHEPHFTVLREEVLFGRQKHNGSDTNAQDTYDKLKGNGGMAAVAEDDVWLYSKPLVMCQVATLREYLMAEFGPLEPRLPFAWDFERVIDDFVFLCFFVGNDFLPHLPTLDIRDGAIDFLYNVYKRVLPTLGDYLTSPGGHVNLEHVDIILAEVGAIEDEVFRRRKSSEDAEKYKRAQQSAARKTGVMGSGLEKLSHNANQGLKDGAVAVGKGVWTPGNGEGIIFPPGDWNCPACNNVVFASKRSCFKCNTPRPVPPQPTDLVKKKAERSDKKNESAADKLRRLLSGGGAGKADAHGHKEMDEGPLVKTEVKDDTGAEAEAEAGAIVKSEAGVVTELTSLVDEEVDLDEDEMAWKEGVKKERQAALENRVKNKQQVQFRLLRGLAALFQT